MKLSIVTTLYNEAENVPHLIDNIDEALKGLDYEVIMVDDGSSDETCDVIRKSISSRYRLLVLNRNYGQTTAMAAGIANANGDFIVTMDADLQNDASDIPSMLSMLLEQNLDVVVGNRKDRQDTWFSRKLPSKIANGIIRNLSGVHVNDYGCTLKIFRKEFAKELRLYGEMHRFIPILAHLDGAHIGEMNVQHHPRKFGSSKYGIGRTTKVVSDLMLLLFFQKYLKNPIHLFGPIALISFGSGILINIYLLILKLMGEDIWGRPILILGAVLIIGGIQLLTFGVIAELVMRIYYESQRKETYRIREIITGKSTPKEAPQVNS